MVPVVSFITSRQFLLLPEALQKETSTRACARHARNSCSQKQCTPRVLSVSNSVRNVGKLFVLQSCRSTHPYLPTIQLQVSEIWSSKQPVFWLAFGSARRGSVRAQTSATEAQFRRRTSHVPYQVVRSYLAVERCPNQFFSTESN